MNGRRGVKGFQVSSLPYMSKVYINGQVLIPAQLVRSLGITRLERASIHLQYRGENIFLENIKLLRTRNTDSRQFTIPKNIREKYNIRSGEKIKIINISK